MNKAAVWNQPRSLRNDVVLLLAQHRLTCVAFIHRYTESGQIYEHEWAYPGESGVGHTHYTMMVGLL